MKFKKLIISACISLTGVTGFCDSWTHIKNVDGVNLYTKKVPGNNHSFFKGEVDIKASLKNVTSILMVRGVGPQWVYQAKSVKTLEENNPNFDLAYWHMTAPWPVKDRDVILKGTAEQDPETLAITIKIQAINSSLVPPHPDRVRIKDSVTTLTATPINNETTHLMMETHVDPAGVIPLFLVEAYAVDSPKYSLINLRKLIEKGSINYSELEQDGFYKLNMPRMKFSK
jgi:START domain